MALSFKQRIITSMMLSAIIPLVMSGAIAAYLGYKTESRMAEEALGLAQDGITRQMNDYLQLVEGQVRENASSPMVHEALKEFISAENGFDASKVAVDQEAVRKRYALQQEKTPGTKAGDENGWEPEGATQQALQYLYTSGNKNPVGEKQKLNNAGDGSQYSEVHAKYHPVFRNIVNEYNYYDYFLVDAATGTVVYTNFKEIDFQSNVKTGPLADSEFSRVVRKAMESHDPSKVFFSDVSSYLPSYDEPAIFAAAPMVEDGKTIGVMAFQMPTDHVNGLFADLKQIGKTVDGFIVGDDMKFKTPQTAENGKVGEAVPESLQKILKNDVFSGAKNDFNASYTGSDGGPMQGEFDRLDIPGLNWALVVGEDDSELLAPTYRQIIIQLIAMAIMASLCGVVGWWSSNILVAPVQLLARSFTASAKKVNTSNGEVTEAVGGMVAASEETSAQSKIIRKNSADASGCVKSVAQAVGELNVSINDISQSIGEANALIDDAVERAKKTDEVVRNLGEAASKITDVVSLINGLAEQTNLLALNAAIEAARAGDAGRGFAVVADEVKKLASHTSDATVEIQDQIQNIQQVTEQSVSALQTVVEAIHRIRDSATTVSAAVEEQSGVAKQIASSVDDAAARVQDVDTNMGGIEQAASDTGVAADQVSGASNQMKGAFDELQKQVGAVLVEMGIKA
jgi:methyl-accepting chemotaxis protein